MRELAGREHDWTAYDSLSLLLVRSLSGNAAAPPPLIARALHAAAAHDGAALRRLSAEVVREPDPFAAYTVWSMVALAENPGAARLLGEPMLSVTKAPGDRLSLRVALGGAELAGGRWRAGAREFVRAREDAEHFGASYDGERILWTTAACAALPALPVPRGALTNLREELAHWEPDAAPPSAHPSPIVPLRPHLRLYLTGILDVRLGAFENAARDAAALEALPAPRGDVGTPDLLARVLRATIASQRGEHARVLSLLARSRGQLPATHEALYFVDIHARWLRAEALRGLGRDAEAIRWYRAATQGTEHGGAPALALMAPSLLRQGELLERRGDSTAARARYGKFVDLWSDADPEALALALSVSKRATASGDTRQRALNRMQQPARQ